MLVVPLCKPGLSWQDLRTKFPKKSMKFHHSYGNSKTSFSFNRFTNSFILPYTFYPKSHLLLSLFCLFLELWNLCPIVCKVFNWVMLPLNLQGQNCQLPPSPLPGGIAPLKLSSFASSAAHQECDL